MFFISSKELFSFSRYSIFVFPTSIHFLPVSHWLRGWFKINRKVYDVSIYLNKNAITHFVWYLEKQKICYTESLPIDRVLCKEHFIEKSCRNYVPKASPGPLFNFGKITQISHWLTGLINNKQDHEKQKEPETNDQSLIRL